MPVFDVTDNAVMKGANAGLSAFCDPEYYDDGDPENGPHLACFAAPIDTIEEICDGIAAIGDTAAYRNAMDGLIWSRHYTESLYR